MKKALGLDDEAEEKVVVEESSSSDDTTLAQWYAVLSQADKATGSSAGSSKRPAGDLKNVVPLPPMKLRIVVGKRAVRKVVVTPDVPLEVSVLSCSQIFEER